MLIIENILLAFAGLKANKMRSILTMLGIIIGISSVIAITIIGDAVNRSVMSSMESMGSNNISVDVGQKDESYDSTLRMKPKDYITDEMIEDMKHHFAGKISAVGLNKQVGEGVSRRNKDYANVTVLGVNEGYLKSNKLTFLAGRSFTEKDQKESGRVAVVSDRYVTNILHMQPENAIGQSVEVEAGNKYYTFIIIGVYKYEKPMYEFSSVSEKDRRTNFYIPLKTAFLQSRAPVYYSNITVIAGGGDPSASLADDISAYMNDKYYKDNPNYNISSFSMDSMISETNKMIDTIKKAIAGAAAISLLVGGIGVMNIMIVSITERTKEIGTRKALGAANGYIRLQFITEAAVICIIGGLIGVILGITAGISVSKLMGYKGNISIAAVAGCVLFSFVFGVFFGFYPANRAAKMEPIEALRYE